MPAREKNPEVWLTTRSRALLAQAHELLPVRARDSNVVEAALEVYVASLRKRSA